MPATPYAKLLATVNGGSTTSGAITCATGDVIQLSGESTVGWQQQRFELTYYPTGFATPAGWTLDGVTGVIFYASSAVPPPFTTGPWGKYMLRLLVNNGRNGAGQNDPTLTDASTALTIASPTGLRDLGFAESNQFSATRLWVADHQANLRVIDTALGAGLTGLSNAAPAAVGIAAVVGVSTLASRGDHAHALGFATLNTVLGTANASIGVNAQKLTNLGAPSAGTSDAATTLYAEGVVTFTRVNAALAAANATITVNAQALTNVSHLDFAASGVAAAGLIRVTAAAQTALAQRNLAGTHDVAAVSFDGADGLVLGGQFAASVVAKSAGLFTVETAASAPLFTVDQGNNRVLLTVDGLVFDDSQTPVIAQKQATGTSNGTDLIITAQPGGSNGSVATLGGSVHVQGAIQSGIAGGWYGNVVLGTLAGGEDPQTGHGGDTVVLAFNNQHTPTANITHGWSFYEDGGGNLVVRTPAGNVRTLAAL